MIVNVWLALRDDAQSAIVTRLNWDEGSQGEYTGPVPDRTARLFQKMADRANVQRLFRVATLNSRQWTLWNVYFNEKVGVLQKVQDELDGLATDYPNQFIIAGAWHWNGDQVPAYPPHPQLIELMPDVDDIGTRPVDLSDVNLLLGQSPRDFS